MNLGKMDYHCKYYKRYNFDNIIKFIKENEIDNIDKLGHILINSLYSKFLLNQNVTQITQITQNVFCKKYKKKEWHCYFLVFIILKI